MNSEKKKISPKTKDQESKSVGGLIPSPGVLAEEENDSGAIRISENVIAAVVRKYTLEVNGVIRFASGSIVGGLAEMIGRKNYEGSVSVELEGDAVNIAVTLVLEFGVCIPEVATLVQDIIQTRVEELTGKHVTKVDVIVQDLEELPEANEPEVEEVTA